MRYLAALSGLLNGVGFREISCGNKSSCPRIKNSVFPVNKSDGHTCYCLHRVEASEKSTRRHYGVVPIRRMKLEQLSLVRLLFLFIQLEMK